MMQENGWADDEHLFLEGKNNSEIRAITGRSTSSIRHKRKRLEAGGALRYILNEQPVEMASHIRSTYPSGWEPGVSWNGYTGTVTSKALEAPDPKWDEYLDFWGFNHNLFEVIEPVQVRTWEAVTKEGVKQLWYYKANIRSRVDLSDKIDIESLVKEVQKRHTPAFKSVAEDDPSAFVVALSDIHIGKDDGDGTEGTVERFLVAIDAVEERIKELRHAGRTLKTLYVLGLGDWIEACGQHYAQQTFRVELNRRDQMKAVRRLVVGALRTWSLLFEAVVVAGVGGNHGENRKGGLSFTDFADNDDVAVLETIAEIFSMNPAYGHINFVIPKDELALTLNIAGNIVAIAHGHQTKMSGGTAQAKIENWWKNQSHGMQPAGDATILMTGHYHYLSVSQQGAKTHIQVPALDGGSQWFTDLTGYDSPAGMLTLVMDKSGWKDLQVL